MARIERSIAIKAPVEKVFAYISDDPMNTLEWLPGMVEVKDVVRTKEGVGSRYRWVYKMAGLPFEGESIATEYVPNQRLVDQSKGGINSTWTWTFAPEGEGTRVNLAIEYTVPIPVLGKLAEALVLRQNEREADLALVNIKARMES